MIKLFCIEILVGLARPVSFFSADVYSLSPFLLGLLPARRALAVNFRGDLPDGLAADPKVPPSFIGLIPPIEVCCFLILRAAAPFLADGESKLSACLKLEDVIISWRLESLPINSNVLLSKL